MPAKRRNQALAITGKVAELPVVIDFTIEQAGPAVLDEQPQYQISDDAENVLRESLITPGKAGG